MYVIRDTGRPGTGQWKRLARHLVHPVTGKVWDEERAISEMKRRVQPVPAPKQ